MITIQDYAEKDEWVALQKKIAECGTDCPKVFGGNSYGGYLLQQNTLEFASLVYFLQKQGPFNVYVEIGSASGGNLRFIHENVGFHTAFAFDDMAHPHAKHQTDNSAGFTEKLTRFMGNSHTKEAQAAFEDWIKGKTIDCAFIDGDHSEDGVTQDFEMLRPYLTGRSLLIFHDTHSVADIGRFTKKMIAAGKITPVAHFAAAQNTCGIMVATIKTQ